MKILLSQRQLNEELYKISYVIFRYRSDVGKLSIILLLSVTNLLNLKSCFY